MRGRPQFGQFRAAQSRSNWSWSLIPVLEVAADLRDFLAENRLTQKYWYQWFAELIVDRLWDDLQERENDDEEDG